MDRYEEYKNQCIEKITSNIFNGNSSANYPLDSNHLINKDDFNYILGIMVDTAFDEFEIDYGYLKILNCFSKNLGDNIIANKAKRFIFDLYGVDEN